jgi:Protein of unknown function (DUF2457)
MRETSLEVKPVESVKPRNSSISQRKPSPAPASKRRLSTDHSSTATASAKDPSQPSSIPRSPPTFHEFASPQDETDTWVYESREHTEKLTLKDCMKKENAIRQLGEEAEEEAEQEEREQEELDLHQTEDGHEDDFAPSDESDDSEESESDGGNESDDEGGFADSDEESEAGSDYRFWAPSTAGTATGIEHFNISHFSVRNRSRASSLESAAHSGSPLASQIGRSFSKRRAIKGPRMRPGTPELPDSTDFVCGTLDEDRPLEAAYIACREQKKRERHITIPQDIDPSFPTTDPEDEDDEDEEEEPSLIGGDPMWLKDQFTEFDQEHRGRPKSGLSKSPAPSLPKQDFLAPRPVTTRRLTPRSPPPPKRSNFRSPPPRKLFGNSPNRLRPSPPHMRLRSPPASPTNVAPGSRMVANLAQRPILRQGPGVRTSSLPRTPNPFFRNFNVGSPSISNVASGAVTPATEETMRADYHVRGPVDIVMGLEKKRQKRKEKFWRQHCRKAAKEHAEKKPLKGRGAERMKELGLECAERNRGYGIGQQQLVISL